MMMMVTVVVTEVPVSEKGLRRTRLGSHAYNS